MSRVDEPRFFDPETAASRPFAPGLVTLVGAGPGDPELLTMKAMRAMAQARLVLYDHLVSPDILALLPHRAKRVYVGKESGHHSMSQEAIIERMVSLAQSGHSLLRLKGGDPHIFGRGGEEAQALAAAGVPFVVIPGISAAQAASAATGIPLTHRDHACSLVLTTGHLRAGPDGGRSAGLDWAQLARPRQTVVVYMGLAALPEISQQLIAHGLAGDTPAALIENASLPAQRCVRGTLATLPRLAQEAEVRSPALLVIGTVVTLHDALREALAAGLARARQA